MNLTCSMNHNMIQEQDLAVLGKFNCSKLVTNDVHFDVPHKLVGSIQ